ANLSHTRARCPSACCNVDQTSLPLATTGVKCLTKCGDISRLRGACVGLGQGNPRTPASAPPRAASADRLDHWWAERGRVGWADLYHHGLERNVPLSTKPGRRIY